MRKADVHAFPRYTGIREQIQGVIQLEMLPKKTQLHGVVLLREGYVAKQLDFVYSTL
jgi:hypothetical protein